MLLCLDEETDFKEEMEIKRVFQTDLAQLESHRF